MVILNYLSISLCICPEYAVIGFIRRINNSVECIETPDNYAERVAELIMQNKIIGHIAGRMNMAHAH